MPTGESTPAPCGAIALDARLRELPQLVPIEEQRRTDRVISTQWLARLVTERTEAADALSFLRAALEEIGDAATGCLASERERVAEELHRIRVEDGTWGRRSPRYWRDLNESAREEYRRRAERILGVARAGAP